MASLAPPSPATARQAAPRRWLWQIQSLVSAYLPLLLMAVLASGTWWLVKNTPAPEGPTEPVPPRHQPDYRMQGFELQRFDASGTLRFRIEGSEMRHFPDNDTIEIDGVRLRGLGADGAVTEAVALRALGKGDGSELQLLGEVRVRRFEAGSGGQLRSTPQLEIDGEFLHALLDRELLRSHLPVRLRYGGSELRAQNLEYDHLKGHLSFTGANSARIDPGLHKSAARP